MLPSPSDIQQSSRSEAAATALASLIDEARSSAPQNFTLRSRDDGLLRDLDSLCYKYFGLSEEEIVLVEDGGEQVIPCAQSHMGALVDLWKPADGHDRQAYVSALVRAMALAR